MNYIVLDLEWNQKQENSRGREGLSGEIIQFGAVKLDDSFAAVDTFDRFVKPVIYVRMNPTVRALTGIGDRDIAGGDPFETVYAQFRSWCGECVFLTWGNDDILVLKENLALHHMDNETLPRCVNVQLLFSRLIMRDNRQYALGKAVQLLNKQPFTAHNALGDAKSTVLVCDSMDMGEAIARYESLSSTDEEGYLQRSFFPSVADDMDRAVTLLEIEELRCPHCGGTAHAGWWITRKKAFHGIAVCEHGGEEFYVQLRFKRDIWGRYSVTRTLYDLTDERYDYYKLLEAEAIAQAEETCRLLGESA